MRAWVCMRKMANFNMVYGFKAFSPSLNLALSFVLTIFTSIVLVGVHMLHQTNMWACVCAKALPMTMSNVIRIIFGFLTVDYFQVSILQAPFSTN